MTSSLPLTSAEGQTDVIDCLLLVSEPAQLLRLGPSRDGRILKMQNQCCSLTPLSWLGAVLVS